MLSGLLRARVERRPASCGCSAVAHSCSTFVIDRSQDTLRRSPFAQPFVSKNIETVESRKLGFPRSLMLGEEMAGAWGQPEKET